jgi:hypothetical protein
MKKPLAEILNTTDRAEVVRWIGEASEEELREMLAQVSPHWRYFELVKAELSAKIAEDARDEERRHHGETKHLLEQLKKPHWTVKPNFWVTVVAAIAALVAAYFAWRPQSPTQPAPSSFKR